MVYAIVGQYFVAKKIAEGIAIADDIIFDIVVLRIVADEFEK